MSSASVTKAGGKSPGPSSTPPSTPPKKGDFLQVTVKGGAKVYQSVYTGQPGSSYAMSSNQTLQQNAVATATGQTRKDVLGNVYDQVILPGGSNTGWIEAWSQSPNGNITATLKDLPGPQSMMQKDINGNWRVVNTSAAKSAINDLRQNANDPAYLSAFVQGLGQPGMSDLLGFTAQTYDATAQTVQQANSMSNAYKVIANAVEWAGQNGLNLDSWSNGVLSAAKNDPPFFTDVQNSGTLPRAKIAENNAVTGTRALFNQMVLDQAYRIMGRPDNTDLNWGEHCASYSYQSLNGAGIRQGMLSVINGDGNGGFGSGRNSALMQYTVANSKNWIHSMKRGLTPGAIVFDPNDNPPTGQPTGHVAIYAGVGPDGQPYYLTTTGLGKPGSGFGGKIHLYPLQTIGGFHPFRWLDLSAG